MRQICWRIGEIVDSEYNRKCPYWYPELNVCAGGMMLKVVSIKDTCAV